MGAIQAALLCLLLYRKRNALPGFIFLSAYLVTMTIQILMKLAGKLWLMNAMMPFYLFSYFLPLLYGPLIWLFVTYWTGKGLLAKKYAIHFLPIILAICSLMVNNSGRTPFYFLYPFFQVRWTMVMELASLACYHYMAFNELRNFSHSLSARRLVHFTSRLLWLRQFIMGSLLVCSFVAILLCLMYFLYPAGQAIRFSFISLTLFVYWVSYKAWIHPELFQVITGGMQEDESRTGGTSCLTVEKKYSSSGLDKVRIQQIIEALECKLQKDKPYLNPELSMEELAASIQCSKHHLSQAMNEYLSGGFYECINQCRVEEAKMMLSNPEKDNHKIASIGFDSGFNSISAFNEVFKKFTGLSPSQFRKQREDIKCRKERV